MVVFPDQVVTIQVGRTKSMSAINEAMSNGHQIITVLQLEKDNE